MINIQKINIAPVKPLGNRNIILQYEIQKAAWVWHPEFTCTKKPHVLKFKCSFELEKTESFNIHVSADHRYELFIDGEIVSRGPDRSDLSHWSFASYTVDLPVGKHEFTATAWWIGNHMPAAQTTNGAGGFIFAAEGHLALLLNTGTGNWLVAEERGWSFDDTDYIYVGSLMEIDAAQMHLPKEYIKPEIIIDCIKSDFTGQITDGWKLFPSPLPDQMWQRKSPGSIKAIIDRGYIVNPESLADKNIPDWQETLRCKKSIIIPENTTVNVLWDLDDYYCAYPEITLTGGKDSQIKLLWAEALFEDIDSDYPRIKGNRDQIADKRFFGRGDAILVDGSQHSVYRPLWWRSGRYILIEIKTNDTPLTIDALEIIETRYPIENSGIIETSDSEINNIVPLAVRGIQMCSHETFMDCPYYEQLMYVGDTRLEMLTTYCMTGDTRLIKRGIELFDWSRYSTGFIHERYPSNPPQLSITFSLIWVAVLKDFAWWRNDEEWVKNRMVGMRCLLENIIHLRNSEGLLEGLPGWSFVDWSPGFKTGMPLCESRGSASSVVNLFFVMALRNAAELENAFGRRYFKNYYEEVADEISQTILNIFWDKKQGLIADDKEHQAFSEHAQCLALLNNVFTSPETEQTILNSLLSCDDMRRVTVYFSFYLMEVLVKYGKIDELIERFDFWKSLQGQGFKTPIESPEPSRSDCHAWGSHPLFHFYASLVGIRPGSPGFKTVLITPRPGKHQSLKAKIPHPEGFIETEFDFNDPGTITGSVTLPDKITGRLVWKDKSIDLMPGANTL